MRKFFTIIILLFHASVGFGQETIPSDAFVDGTGTLLVLNVSKQEEVLASLHSIEPARGDISYLELYGVKYVTHLEVGNSNHIATLLKHKDRIFLLYNRQPSISSATEIIKFGLEATYRDIEFSDSSQLGELGDGLFVFRNGLRTRIQSNFSRVRPFSIEGFGSIRVNLPKAVAFILPEGFEGRTISNSGSMYDPQPVKTKPMITFLIDSTKDNTFKIDYATQPPKWFGDATEILLKAIGMLIPIALLVFSNSRDLNYRFYNIVLLVTIFVILLFYGVLTYLAWKSATGYAKIVENAFFGFLTAFISYLTYKLTIGKDFTRAVTEDGIMPNKSNKRNAK